MPAPDCRGNGRAVPRPWERSRPPSWLRPVTRPARPVPQIHGPTGIDGWDWAPAKAGPEAAHAVETGLAQRAGAVSDDIGSHPAGTVCPTCLAFAHIAGVVTSTIVAPLLSLEFHWSAASPFAQRPADAPAMRARGPPVFF